MAALYVLIGHSKWLLWEGFTEGYKTHPEAYSLIDKIQVYGIACFSFGHQAVMLFFVLSGFVIHYSSYNQSLKTGGLAIGTYLGKRIKRIYPPFLFALLLTFVLDGLGTALGYNIYTGTTNFWLMNKNITSDLSLTTLLGSLGMVQTMLTPLWGTDGPLWTLMYEWWFYILYIPVFFINKRSPVLTTVIVAATFILSLCVSTEDYPVVKIFNYFFAWYIGVLVADWYLGRLGSPKHKAALVAFVVLVIVAATVWGNFKDIADYYTSLMFAVLIYTSILFHNHLTQFRILQPLSDLSYTLYVIHFPILVFMSGWLQQYLGGALPMHFGYLYLGVAICLFVAWLAHYLVERPFVRKR